MAEYNFVRKSISISIQQDEWLKDNSDVSLSKLVRRHLEEKMRDGR